MRLDSKHGFLLKLRLVHRDNFENRLLVGCVVRVHEVQDVRFFSNDCAIRAAPLARGLPNGETLRKTRSDGTFQELSPFRWRDNTRGLGRAEVQRFVNEQLLSARAGVLMH